MPEDQSTKAFHMDRVWKLYKQLADGLIINSEFLDQMDVLMSDYYYNVVINKPSTAYLQQG